MSSCCGQPATKPLSENHRIKIRYLGGRPVRVAGIVTGQPYEFSGKVREQLVDPRDAAPLLRTKGFQAIGLIELHNRLQDKDTDHG